MKRLLCILTVLQLAGTIGAQHAVDLGLSVLWADCNVGAAQPEDAGIYVAWGELQPKDEYLMRNYRFFEGEFRSPTKYYAYNANDTSTLPDGKTVLEPEDDVATVMLGSGWRTPRYEELRELADLCSWEWIADRTHAGYRVTGPNGNSIFLPATGIYTGSRLMLEGHEGYYWASQSLYVPDNAYCLRFTPRLIAHPNFKSTPRFNGCTVRAVAQQPTVQRITERGKLLVGTTGDYRPLSYRESDGNYWGFGIEMAEKIAERLRVGERSSGMRLGVGIEFVQTSWPTLTADVQAEPQTFDLAIGGITITDTRKETMMMSDGYLCNGKTILCRATEADRYQSLADIDKPEVRVMVNPGGLNEKFANENLTHATIIVWQKNEEIPAKVADGDADVMITEITEAPWYVQNDTRLAAPLLNASFTHGEIGVLMRKGQDDLLALVNAVIAQMKADGSLRKLHEKYGLIYGY